jgi:beta-glucosidase
MVSVFLVARPIDTYPHALFISFLVVGHQRSTNHSIPTHIRYDHNNIAPAFPFGHGLSYARFEYRDLFVSSVTRTVSFTVSNVEGPAGAEVAQLYLGYQEEYGEPPKVLRGFEKVLLDSGATAAVEFTLREKDVSFWNASLHDWQIASGRFQVYVGASSRDIRLHGLLVVA